LWIIYTDKQISSKIKFKNKAEFNANANGANGKLEEGQRHEGGGFPQRDMVTKWMFHALIK
jgi:hypothetical protein